MNDKPPTSQKRLPKKGSSYYVTTAIPYVNGPPHIGFALELIQADVMARHRRGQGFTVRFQAGTDENSLKNVEAASALGVDTQTLVERNAERFRALGSTLNLSVDDFIRTSAEHRHAIGVEALWRRCAENGDIYRKAYTGLYCLGCEQYYRPADLIGGCCPEHGTHPEVIAEENYFFRLSRYQEPLERLIRSGELAIEPASRKNEVLRWIEDGLEDFSISRSGERARGWGIPVPDDPEQVIYVWFDALGNYITALGYSRDEEAFRRFWCGAAAREHVIGKGVTRFHAVYWPAMLLSAGLVLPTRILVHGYVTVEGAKIGKSAGNAIDPVPLASELGTDALRYFLLRSIRTTEDGDFTRERFVQAYRSDLAGQLGNLAHRVFSMIDRYCEGIIPEPLSHGPVSGPIDAALLNLPDSVDRQIDRFALHDALTQIWQVVSLANRYVADCKPWALAKQAQSEPDSDVASEAFDQLHHCLFTLASALYAIARCLAPFLPDTSSRLLNQMGLDPQSFEGSGKTRLAGNRINREGVLFPAIDA